jgi:Astacin (Peptidase family M12A)
LFSAQAENNIIISGLVELQSKTCVRFVYRTNHVDYIQIINGAGCYSRVGRQGGKQEISLQRNGCVYKGTAMHEFIHALGYTHMQNHIDRDRFVRVYLQNVDSNQRHNFDKVDTGNYGNFGTSYDYLSVMHYGRNAFGIGGRDTMVPIDSSYLNRIGSSLLSPGDVTRINNMYQCRV